MLHVPKPRFLIRARLVPKTRRLMFPANICHHTMLSLAPCRLPERMQTDATTLPTRTMASSRRRPTRIIVHQIPKMDILVWLVVALGRSLRHYWMHCVLLVNRMSSAIYAPIKIRARQFPARIFLIPQIDQVQPFAKLRRILRIT